MPVRSRPDLVQGRRSGWPKGRAGGLALVLAIQAWRLADQQAAEAALTQLRAAPQYQPMRARQILAPPHGFVWRLEAAGSGAMRMSGSDAMADQRSWTRFWLFWTLPVVVVREGEDLNHMRSSFGRGVAEAVFWAPAALLPQNGVQWEDGEGPGRAHAVVMKGALAQELEIAVAEDGRPLWAMIPRWSNANPEGEWRVQPFGGTLEDFQVFGGFTLPTRVDGGNHFGTEDYFPFFRARVQDVRFGP